MPLFNFQCKNCELVLEKFQRGKDTPEIICPECDNTEFSKLLSACNNRVRLNAKEFYSRKIAPDAKRIRNEISKGKDKHFLDLYGEK